MIFYGSYDENLYWNGRCIYNTYTKGKLVGITDGYYEHGKIKAYQRVSLGKGDKWWVQDRTQHENYNMGETWEYIHDMDIEMNFSPNEVMIDDIMSVQDFQEGNTKLHMPIKYYRGRTKGGFFNDDTGMAYVIEFYEDGSIKEIYNGRFVNGMYTDERENTAWRIYSVGGEWSGYFFYRGEFLDGNMVDDNSIKVASLEEMQEILNSVDFYQLELGGYDPIWDEEKFVE